MFFSKKTKESIKTYSDEETLEQIRKLFFTSDAILVGGGAGLSTAAGFTYSGPRFENYFSDFQRKFGFDNMYVGGFYPFPTQEEYWAYWSRFIWINRYAPIPTGLYDKLRTLLQGRDYFVLTTNVDHCFQRSGFDKKRLFYTQGDYGLLQSADPQGASLRKTYDNKEILRPMLLAQGFTIGLNDELEIPEGVTLKSSIPSELIPVCPDDGGPMTTNLRADDKFVEDEGWVAAYRRYKAFVEEHSGSRILYLELGVGYNTPGIIKYNFWNMTDRNPRASYVCLNAGHASAPEEIRDRSVWLNADIAAVLAYLAAPPSGGAL